MPVVPRQADEFTARRVSWFNTAAGSPSTAPDGRSAWTAPDPENISTVEVEQTIDSHPGVLESAVVGVPDEKWGERPKAFVVLKPGVEVSEAELIAHVQSRIARFKTPRTVEFV